MSKAFGVDNDYIRGNYKSMEFRAVPTAGTWQGYPGYFDDKFSKGVLATLEGIGASIGKHVTIPPDVMFGKGKYPTPKRYHSDFTTSDRQHTYRRVQYLMYVVFHYEDTRPRHNSYLTCCNDHWYLLGWNDGVDHLAVPIFHDHSTLDSQPHDDFFVDIQRFSDEKVAKFKRERPHLADIQRLQEIIKTVGICHYDYWTAIFHPDYKCLFAKPFPTDTFPFACVASWPTNYVMQSITLEFIYTINPTEEVKEIINHYKEFVSDKETFQSTATKRSIYVYDRRLARQDKPDGMLRWITMLPIAGQDCFRLMPIYVDLCGKRFFAEPQLFTTQLIKKYPDIGSDPQRFAWFISAAVPYAIRLRLSELFLSVFGDATRREVVYDVGCLIGMYMSFLESGTGSNAWLLNHPMSRDHFCQLAKWMLSDQYLASRTENALVLLDVIETPRYNPVPKTVGKKVIKALRDFALGDINPETIAQQVPKLICDYDLESYTTYVQTELKHPDDMIPSPSGFTLLPWHMSKW